MTRRELLYIVVVLEVVVVLLVIIILSKKKQLPPPTPTPTPSPPIQCAVYPPCPPGYEEDPLTGCCSPLVPANIVPAPSPSLQINVFTVLNPHLTSPSVGFLSSSCSRSSPCINQYCEPTPAPANVSSSQYFYVNVGKVVSSNGTPIPGVKVDVYVEQNFFPQEFEIPIYESEPLFNVQVATIAVKVYAPPSEVTTDSDGNINIPFLAEVYVKSYNSYLYHLLTPAQGCFPSNIVNTSFRVTVQVAGTPLSIIQEVGFVLNYCGCGCGGVIFVKS